MSPRLSVERNAFAPIGKPMALSHSAAEDEHGDVDAGAGDGDFSCVDAIDGFGDGWRAGFGARVRDARARTFRRIEKAPPTIVDEALDAVRAILS